LIARRARVALAPVVILLACGAEDTGTLELRWRLPAAGAGGLAEVHLVPDWGGANRGPLRDENWTRIPLSASGVTLPSADGAATAVARGSLAAGRYDRVFVAAAEVTGRRPDGTSMDVIGHIEPIARGFDLPAGGQVTIDIELIVLPSTERRGTAMEIFVKDAAVVDGAAASPAASGR